MPSNRMFIKQLNRILCFDTFSEALCVEGKRSFHLHRSRSLLKASTWFLRFSRGHATGCFSRRLEEIPRARLILKPQGLSRRCEIVSMLLDWVFPPLNQMPGFLS
jgi:hypothetical protein